MAKRKYVTVKLEYNSIVRIEWALAKEMHSQVNIPTGYRKLKTRPNEQVAYWSEEDRQNRDAYIKLWEKFWRLAEDNQPRRDK